MKFKIVYDRNDILRVRLGKGAFTPEQGYGLSRLLSEKEGIKTERRLQIGSTIGAHVGPGAFAISVSFNDLI